MWTEYNAIKSHPWIERVRKAAFGYSIQLFASKNVWVIVFCSETAKVLFLSEEILEVKFSLNRN